MSERNCPFYGYSAASTHLAARSRTSAGVALFMLVSTGGNQYALVTGAHAPCGMEVNGLPVEWRKCPLIGEHRFDTD